MVNRVILIGNLGKDPEVRRLENGAAVAKFSLATNENYKDKSGEWQTQTEWHNIVAWRNLAERAETSLKKGMTLYVEGKLSTRSWQDQDGNTRYTTEVVANYFRILNKKEAGPGSGSGDGYFPSMDDESSSSSNNHSSATASPSQEEISDAATADDDLPF